MLSNGPRDRAAIESDEPIARSTMKLTVASADLAPLPFSSGFGTLLLLLGSCTVAFLDDREPPELLEIALYH